MLSKKLRRCLCHIEFYVQKKKLKLKQKIMFYFFTMVKWISFIFIAGYMVYKYQEPFIKIYKEIRKEVEEAEVYNLWEFIFMLFKF